jgi:predicted metal-dependent hydrolase
LEYVNALEKEQRSISLSGKEISFSVLSSRKARRLKLQMSIEDGLEVVIPARASVPFSMVEKFLFEKQAWILKHLSRLEAVARESEASRNSLLFLGREAPIEITECNRLGAKAFPTEGRLLVKVPFGKNPWQAKPSVHSIKSRPKS